MPPIVDSNAVTHETGILRYIVLNDLTKWTSINPSSPSTTTSLLRNDPVSFHYVRGHAGQAKLCWIFVTEF